jgi:hypothetical protein
MNEIWSKELTRVAFPNLKIPKHRRPISVNYWIMPSYWEFCRRLHGRLLYLSSARLPIIALNRNETYVVC